METDAELNLPLAFAAGDGGEPASLRLKRLHRDDGGLAAIVETDTETAARGLFHDTPENRLEEVEGGFDAGLPVLIDLELRPEWRNSLPDPTIDIGQWLPPSELLRDDAWNARVVWQEHPLPPALGGDAMRVGYRTVFSPARSEIDQLKRRGRVTRTVVEALIENGLPIRFETELGSFEVGLGVGESEYTCRLRPDEATTGIELTVIAGGGPYDPEAIAEVNGEVPAGLFEVGDGTLLYVHELQIDPALVSEAWVMETLRAGVSVMHHYASRLLD
jgi:hypothetical protein